MAKGPIASARQRPTLSAAESLAQSDGIRRAMGYRKFVANRPLTVLVLESAYHLQGESIAALQALGHKAVGVNVRLEDAPQVVRALLAALVAHRPDMVLCINHLGFDNDGTVGGLLEALQVPVACWYVDSPFFVLRGEQVPANAVTSLFVWEQALVPTLRQLGAQDVHYLPLASDTRKFATSAQPIRYPLSFVGNSMEQPGRKWQKGLRGAQRELAAQWKASLEARRCNLVDEAVGMQQQQPSTRVWDALASATYSATGTYRAQLLRALVAQQPLHIFGDPLWQAVLPQARLHPLVPYGPPLAQVYRSSAINVNATSLQMPTAVNQRVFDVPAAGGFLLTDAQSDVGLHFELGREVVTFEGPQDLAALAKFYGDRPTLREQVVARAYARVAREHTYVHRLAQLVATMRQRHRPQLATPRPKGRPCFAAPS